MHGRRYQRSEQTVQIMALLDELFPDPDFDVEINGRVWKRFKPKGKR